MARDALLAPRLRHRRGTEPSRSRSVEGYTAVNVRSGDPVKCHEADRDADANAIALDGAGAADVGTCGKRAEY